MKAALLAKNSLSNEIGKTHDLVKLAGAIRDLYPTLSDRSFEIFCRVLTPYQQYGHYPEMILDYPRLRGGWNRYLRLGIKEADLASATLRAIAIEALDRRPDSAYFLEAIVHGDTGPFISGVGAVVEHASACFRNWLLFENSCFTVESLPTFHQRYEEHVVFPLVPLPLATPRWW